MRILYYGDSCSQLLCRYQVGCHQWCWHLSDIRYCGDLCHGNYGSINNVSWSSSLHATFQVSAEISGETQLCTTIWHMSISMIIYIFICCCVTVQCSMGFVLWSPFCVSVPSLWQGASVQFQMQYFYGTCQVLDCCTLSWGCRSSLLLLLSMHWHYYLPASTSESGGPIFWCICYHPNMLSWTNFVPPPHSTTSDVTDQSFIYVCICAFVYLHNYLLYCNKVFKLYLYGFIWLIERTNRENWY